MSKALSSRILRVSVMTSFEPYGAFLAGRAARVEPRSVRLHRSIFSGLLWYRGRPAGAPRAGCSPFCRMRFDAANILYILVSLTSIYAWESHRGRRTAHLRQSLEALFRLGRAPATARQIRHRRRRER